MKTVIRNSYTPKIGDYCDTLVVDKETKKRYLFDSDGVYTALPWDIDVEEFVDEAVAEANEYTDSVADTKVDKVPGKGLSSNDFTDAEKTKLSTVEDNAQENVIETVKVNGTALTVTGKAVDVSVPTTTSALVNDSGFITNAVDDLTNYYDKTAVDNAIAGEVSDRKDADNALQQQIDAISAASGVVDIVGTYADLQNYDTTKLHDNDIIKVLDDSTQNDATTYYRWDTDTSTFSYIGSEGPYYTKSEADSEFVPQTRTINSKALSANITLTASDVGALPDSTVIPTVNDATLKIQKNGTDIATFTANSSTNTTANISVPTKTSDLTNNGSDNTSTYVEADELATVATSGSYNDLLDKPHIPDDMVVLSYGHSTYAEALAAYQSNSVVYCRASSNSNPGTGSQNRMAFLAYVNDSTTPTEFEFQYYRSVATHSDSQQGDQVYVYKLNSSGTWSVTTREAYTKVVAGTNMTSSYSSGAITLNATQPTVNDATLTIQKNGTNVGTFTANASSNSTIDITVPTKTSDLNNDSGFITNTVNNLTNYYDQTSINNMFNALPAVPTNTSDLNNDSGFLTTSTLPIATTNSLGVIKVGSGLSVDANGVLSSSALQSVDWSDITNKPTNVSYWTNDAGYITSAAVPTNTSDLVNDSGFITSADIPTNVSSFVNDSGYITNTVNNLTNYYTTSNTYTQAEVNALFNALSIPTNTSDLNNDSGFVTNTDYASANDAGVIKVGSGLTISSGGVLSATGGGVADSVAWGHVTGTLADQTDLQNALDAKADTSSLATVATSGNYSDLSGTPSLATVATSGSYNDLTNKPTIPTKTSDLTNNGSDNTSVYVEADELATVATSGSYTDLTDKPTIPTVNNATLTIQRNSTTIDTFTANAASNKTINISVPTKTSDLTNDGANNTSPYIETDDAQKFAIGQGSTNPVFDDMTPVRTIEWDIATAAYRPIYTIANTGWTYTNMDITIAYRITVTGTNIEQIVDVVDRWINPISYPITSAMMRTKSTSAGTTGFRYLRAVWPTSTYLNNATYPLGVEIYPYNSTSRHIKIEVFKDNSNVTWNTTLAGATIYVDSTHNGYNSIETYTTRGWKFRQPTQMYANSAGSASYVTDFEAVNTNAGDLKAGATALVAGHYAFLADDGRVYDVSNTTANIAVGESKFGFINSAVNANAAISYTYWRAISRPNATQVEYFSHDALTLGDRVFLRCTMDANGKIHSDNYLSTTMSAGYTWMPFGWARSSTTLYVDTRFPKFYTLDADGKLTHIDGQAIASGMTSVAWNDITGKPTFATVATSGLYSDLSGTPSLATVATSGLYSDLTGTPSLATVATSGSYNDLSDKPTIPTVNNATLTIQKNGTTVKTFTANASSNVTANITVPTKTSDLTNDGADNTSTYVEADELATVATSGSYADLSNKPTIPTVNNATLTIQKNSTTVATFTANASSAVTADISVPTSTSDLTNTSDFQTSADVQTAIAGKQDALTAGDHIDITGSTISAIDYVHSENPVSTTAVTPIVTGSMITDGTITADKLAPGVNITLTLSTTDIGEGAALAANTLYGVYQ